MRLESLSSYAFSILYEFVKRTGFTSRSIYFVPSVTLLLFLVFLYIWLPYIIFCIILPFFTRIFLRHVIKSISIGGLSLYPFEIRNFALVMNSSSRKRFSPQFSISFRSFKFLWSLKRSLFPLLDLLQVLPTEFYSYHTSSQIQIGHSCDTMSENE